MYNKDDKRRIYWLIQCYLNNKIDENTFCDEFYFSYDLEIDYKTLSTIELKKFNELNEIVSRFSEFEEDHALDPNAFYTKEELRNKIQETYHALIKEK